MADLVVTNAFIYTSDSSLPFAQAMAVRKGRILRIGSSSSLQVTVPCLHFFFFPQPEKVVGRGGKIQPDPLTRPRFDPQLIWVTYSLRCGRWRRVDQLWPAHLMLLMISEKSCQWIARDGSGGAGVGGVLFFVRASYPPRGDPGRSKKKKSN